MNKKSIGLICLLSIFILSLFPLSTHGQAYRGPIIDQIKFEIPNAEKGKSYPLSFTLTHDYQDKNKKITFYLRAKNFTSDGTSGAPKFLAPNELSPQASLADWITYEKESITLSQYGQKETINFIVNVPEDAEPGGKYAAVLLADTSAKDDLNSSDKTNKLGMNQELGPLVILTVEGELTKGIQANSFYTTNIKGKSQKFYFNPPVNLITNMQNLGNTHTIPRGVMYIYKGNNFQNYVAKFDLNKDGGYVLPSSSRRFTETWNESFITTKAELQEDGKTKYSSLYNWDQLSKLRIGKYNVKLMYNSQSENGNVQTLEMNTYFWMIPWQLIVLVLVLIVYLYIKYRLRTNKKNSTENSARKKQSN